MVEVWNQYLALCTRKKEASKEHSALVDALTEEVKKKYAAFTADGIRDLVINGKWLKEVRSRSEAENKRVCESISSQVLVLNERYAKPLPTINNEIAKLSAEVDGFLKEMGIKL